MLKIKESTWKEWENSGECQMVVGVEENLLK